MTSPVDTPDWKLAANLSWEFIGKDTSRSCDYCGGRGEVGGGFKSLDGPEPCPRCFGAGGWLNPRSEHPSYPPGLIEHMRKAYREFFDNYQHGA